MRVKILQRLPGTIGNLPAGEHFEADSVHDVEDTIAETMKRNGWAVDAPSSSPAPTPAPLFGSKEHAS